jgi:hypothetical protein
MSHCFSVIKMYYKTVKSLNICLVYSVIGNDKNL